MNGTLICAEDGAVVPVVVTMQDLAPLQELERQRAEFLGMVSHELRSPLTAIKGSAATLLEEAPELEAAEMHEFFRIIHEQTGHMRGLIGALLDAGRVVTYETLVRRVWNNRAAGNADLVRNVIKKLRAKIGEDAENPIWIHNVRGVGYRMPRPDDS